MDTATPTLSGTDLSIIAALNMLPSKCEIAGLPRLYPQKAVLGPFASGAQVSLGSEALSEGIWCFLQPFERMHGCRYTVFMGPTEVAQGECPAGQNDPVGFFIEGQALTDALDGVAVFDLYAKIRYPGAGQEEETERLILAREPGKPCLGQAFSGEVEPCLDLEDIPVIGRVLHSWTQESAAMWAAHCCSCRSPSANGGSAGNGGSPGQQTPAPLSFGGPHDQTVDPSYIIAKGRAPTMPAASAMATYTRVAEHGVAPYHYESSAPDVAVVDQNGRVVAAGNGSAEIHATDSAGTRASYTITFSGVKLVSREDDVAWPPPVGNPKRPEYATNRKQLELFWMQYKDEAPDKSVPQILGWPNTPYWTSENIETDPTAWAVHLEALVPDFKGFVQASGTPLPALRRLGF